MCLIGVKTNASCIRCKSLHPPMIMTFPHVQPSFHAARTYCYACRIDQIGQLVVGFIH